MEYDDAMVGRILTRRRAISAAAQAGFAVALGGALSRRTWAQSASSAAPKIHLVASPALTEGPFFVDEKLNRSDLRTGTNRPTVVRGVPLLLALTVYKFKGGEYAPLKDATVDVWHTDAAGVYSDENNPMNHEDTSKQTWLRGYQLTDGSGKAAFTTIYPGWYRGRAPHIHFKVRQFSSAGNSTMEFTSQFFFDDALSRTVYALPPYNAHGEMDSHNDDDGIFSEALPDGTTAGSHLTLDLKKNAKLKSFETEYAIVLTEENTRARRERGPRRGPPPGGPGFGPPPD